MAKSNRYPLVKYLKFIDALPHGILSLRTENTAGAGTFICGQNSLGRNARREKRWPSRVSVSGQCARVAGMKQSTEQWVDLFFVPIENSCSVRRIRRFKPENLMCFAYFRSIRNGCQSSVRSGEHYNGRFKQSS